MKNLEKIILKVKSYSPQKRIQRLCELAIVCNVMEEQFAFVFPEEVFEYGILQGMRLQSGEIDKVLESLKNTERNENGKIKEA